MAVGAVEADAMAGEEDADAEEDATTAAGQSADQQHDVSTHIETQKVRTPQCL